MNIIYVMRYRLPYPETGVNSKDRQAMTSTPTFYQHGVRARPTSAVQMVSNTKLLPHQCIFADNC